MGLRCQQDGMVCGEGLAHDRCSVNRSEVGCGGGSGLGPLPLCSRACNYHLPWSVGLRDSMCGQSCGQGARLAPLPRQVPRALCGPSLMADIPGTFPIPRAATGQYRLGAGVIGFRLDKPVSLLGWASLSANFLLALEAQRGLQVLPSASTATITTYPHWHRSLHPSPPEILSPQSAGGVLWNC